MRFRLTIALLAAVFALFSCDTKVKTVDSCGDGLMDPGEACDQAIWSVTDCRDLGYYQIGALACLDTCEFDTTACGPKCGDGEVDIAFGEQCEGVDLSGNSCTSLGYTAGVLACGADCLFDETACQSDCGNETIDAGEACDDGDREDGDGCSRQCQVEEGWLCDDEVPSVCISACGNGIRTGEEVCDGEDYGALTCYEGTFTCTPECDEVQTGDCLAFCGDAVRQQDQGEACEAVEDCGRYGFSSGEIACSADCTARDEAGCAGWRMVAAGANHTCAIDSDRRLWCWGDNNYGQLGIGSTTGSDTPVAVTIRDTLGNELLVNQVAAGVALTCAVVDGELLYCWGRNHKSQVGDGTTTQRNSPVRVAKLFGGTIDFTSVKSVGCGAEFACAVHGSDRRVSCWGDNSLGQNGDNSILGLADRPTRVHTNSSTVNPDYLTGVTSMSVGGAHACAVVNGNLHCWGSDRYGQIGIQAEMDDCSGFPCAKYARMLIFRGFQGLGLGTSHSCGFTTTAAYCWGLNDRGQLGLGDTTSRETPEVVAGQVPVGLAGGGAFTCALSATGVVSCWGANDNGQLGQGDTNPSLTPVIVGSTDETPSTAPNATFLNLGAAHACILEASGALSCWGQNLTGQCGRPAGEEPRIPSRVWMY